MIAEQLTLAGFFAEVVAGPPEDFVLVGHKAQRTIQDGSMLDSMFVIESAIQLFQKGEMTVINYPVGQIAMKEEFTTPEEAVSFVKEKLKR